MPETKRFWLSFCDDEKPAGQQFLGVAIVEVTALDVEAIRPVLARKFPYARVGAEWIAAASRKAHDTGCNPGGQMLSAEVPPGQWEQFIPLHQLLSRQELIDRNLGDQMV